MDMERFDRIAIAAAGASSRRGLLRLVAGGALGAAALGVLGRDGAQAKTKAKRRCKNGRKRCDGQCVNLDTDDENCGACGKVCRGDTTCRDGECVGNDAASPNNAPLSPAPADCGGGCAFNLVCREGACVAADNFCPDAFACPDPFGGPAPVCGSVAGGGTCGCYRSTENNNVCVNETFLNDQGEVDFIDSDTLQPCTSSQDCRDTVGFNFYCRAVTSSPSGRICGSEVGRCWPQCDSPNIFP